MHHIYIYILRVVHVLHERVMCKNKITGSLLRKFKRKRRNVILTIISRLGELKQKSHFTFMR